MEDSAILDPGSYVDDEPYGFVAIPPGVQPESIPESQWVMVPERIFHRLFHMGQAYSLHFSQIISPYDYEDFEFNSSQCQSFLEEITFLRSIVTDLALTSFISRLEDVLVKVIRQPELSLLVSAP